MKQTFWFLMMLTALTLTACSKDDDNDNGTQEEDAAELAQIQEKQQADLMVNALCSYNATTATYTPRIGEAINATTPTIFYAIANTADEARSKYEGIVGITRTGSSSTATLPTDVKRGDLHLTFAPSTAAGETARITVDCPRLASVLTAIVFIPETAWPENDDTPSPFNFLSVWRQKSTGYYYLCTKASYGGGGQMLTFDGGWEEDWFTRYEHWQGQFYLWKNTASEKAFDGLCDGLKYSQDTFRALLNALSSKGASSTTCAMLTSLFNGGEATFDVDYTYDHHLWWAYDCWDVTMKKLQISAGGKQNYYSVVYTHKDVPVRTTASHSFTFEPTYTVNNAEWELVYLSE